MMQPFDFKIRFDDELIFRLQFEKYAQLNINGELLFENNLPVYHPEEFKIDLLKGTLILFGYVKNKSFPIHISEYVDKFLIGKGRFTFEFHSVRPHVRPDKVFMWRENNLLFFENRTTSKSLPFNVLDLVQYVGITERNSLLISSLQHYFYKTRDSVPYNAHQF